jgi:hypothetical protein
MQCIRPRALRPGVRDAVCTRSIASSSSEVVGRVIIWVWVDHGCVSARCRNLFNGNLPARLNHYGTVCGAIDSGCARRVCCAVLAEEMRCCLRLSSRAVEWRGPCRRKRRPEGLHMHNWHSDSIVNGNGNGDDAWPVERKQQL